MKGLSVSFFRQKAIILLMAFSVSAFSACQKNSCPANNGGYMQSHKTTKRQSKKKPKSGLWGKDMKRRR